MSTDEVTLYKARLDQLLATLQPLSNFLGDYYRQLRSAGLPDDICYELVLAQAQCFDGQNDAE